MAKSVQKELLVQKKYEVVKGWIAKIPASVREQYNISDKRQSAMPQQKTTAPAVVVTEETRVEEENKERKASGSSMGDDAVFKLPASTPGRAKPGMENEQMCCAPRYSPDNARLLFQSTKV